MIRQLEVQASDRGCGQPHGRVQAVRRLPRAADRRMIGVQEPANGESRLNPITLPGGSMLTERANVCPLVGPPGIGRGGCGAHTTEECFADPVGVLALAWRQRSEVEDDLACCDVGERAAAIGKEGQIVSIVFERAGPDAVLAIGQVLGERVLKGNSLAVKFPEHSFRFDTGALFTGLCERETAWPVAAKGFASARAY
jgi:hypothetical protein